MEKVTGIGGVFVRAKDPGALAKWYETHFGINPAPKDMTPPLWVSDAGVTVFLPFRRGYGLYPERSGIYG